MGQAISVKDEATTLGFTALKGVKIAVVIPCYNEELTIAGVISEFHKQLPDADIYVFDKVSEFDFQLRSLFDELSHQTPRTNADRGRWSS